MTDSIEAQNVQMQISIHTPTQGVTINHTEDMKMGKISIHTPTQGVTLWIFRLSFLGSISIHTPTQGVTGWGCRGGGRFYISIHTPTQGVTSIKCQPWLIGLYFNPHSHAGSDCSFAILSSAASHFNPHSHAGSDSMCVIHLQLSGISIHTPTQGVT